jgi:pectate lyase
MIQTNFRMSCVLMLGLVFSGGCSDNDSGEDLDATSGVDAAPGADAGAGADANAGGDGGGADGDVNPETPRAFPGAQGLAALSRGAAGHTGAKSIAIVTNTDDSGSGSLREAMEGPGKEGTFVIFRTSGVINLTSSVDIESSYITVAGQTSPGGISTAGNLVQVGNDGIYDLHDVVIRHLRFRPGSHGGAAPSDQEAFRIWKSHDIMIDHCSMSWGGDETVSVTTYDNASAYNITFSHCIISHGLTDVAPEADHGYGLLFNGGYANTPPNSMDIHHSYFCHHNSRMPQLSGAGTFNLVNNVIYNFYATQNTVVIPSATWAGDLHVNFIGNYAKRGVDSNDPIGAGGNAAELTSQGGGGTQGCPDSGSISPFAMIYMADNFGVLRTSDADDDWAVSCGWSANLLSTSWQSLTEFTLAGGVPITRTDLQAATAEAQAADLLTNVGATRPVRDSYDDDIVSDFSNDTGSLIGDVTYPDDWPVYANTAPPTDTNGDAIPDAFEVDRGFAIGTLDPFGTAPSGYLWVEEYINDLAQ